ncbi:efflux RND transporter permease subunit [Kribbella alba]|uniref:Efflux RND transporter permease subunit n=1 Tax=Kribbella alba TaxID=190197 RepID=A0ABN2FIV5_9ACTN
MMRWIVRSSLRYRYLVVALGAVLMAFGAGQVRDMPVDVFPEFAPPQVEVQTPSLGLSAAEVEGLVTVPMEDALNGVDGLSEMRSKSVPQLSSIKLIFKPGTDLLRARQLVSERVQAITPSLPTWSSPPVMLQPLSATSRVMKIGLSSETHSLIEMSMTSYWTIRERLLRVPGVANVTIWGERLQMMQVQADPVRLAQHDVSLDTVMNVTADALDSGLLQFSNGALIGTGGFIDTPNQRLAVNNKQAIVTPADLGQIPVATKNGKVLRLSDVATVKEDHQALIGDAVINDGPGLMLVVEKLPWGNTLDVTRGVEEAIDQMRPGLTGYQIDTTIFRPATFVEHSIDNLTRALLLGFGLVILIVFLFLFEWRAALISIISIPLSLMAAGLILQVRGETINTMILAGLVIALGALVDDAIIDVENIMRRLRQHRASGSDRSTASVILEASLEVRGPIVSATLIIVVATAPVFLLEGLTGSFFRPLALSYTLATLASLVVALTVTPALALMLLRGTTKEHHDSPLARLLRRGYLPLLRRIIKRPRRAYAAALVTLLAGVLVLPLVGQSLLPSFKERDFLMHWVTEPSTSHPEMVRITTEASKELRQIDGVRNFGAHIGQALIADEVVGVNFGENWISVDEEVDYDETLASVQGVVNGYPGLFRDVQTYLKERIREVLTGSKAAIVVRIYGDDLATLHTKAEEIGAMMGKVDGVIEEHVELHVDVPQVEVKVNLAAAQKYKIKPGDVRRAAAAWIAGEEVGDLFRAGKAYDVQVWSTPETRNSVSSVQSLLIDKPGGGHVRLGEVADVAVRPTPNVIERTNSSRRIDVIANIEGQDLGAVVADIEDELEEVTFAQGYHAELKGEFSEREAAQNRLLLFAAAAALGIFLLLQTSFGSWRLATLTLVTLPMALVGGLLAVWAGDGIISLGALVGFFTVFGIAARNGILMINHFQHLEREEGMPFGLELVLRGAMERLNPILMTSLATGLALVPLVVAGQIPGHEIEYPLAIVILGGLFTSTLLNLFVVPALYLRFGKPKQSRREEPAEVEPSVS